MRFFNIKRGGGGSYICTTCLEYAYEQLGKSADSSQSERPFFAWDAGCNAEIGADIEIETEEVNPSRCVEVQMKEDASTSSTTDDSDVQKSNAERAESVVEDVCNVDKVLKIVIESLNAGTMSRHNFVQLRRAVREASTRQ